MIEDPYSVKQARRSKVRIYSIILLCSIVGTVYLTVSLETYVREPVAIWEELNNPWAEALYDIAFLNSSHGWAIGMADAGTGERDCGVVLQTKDGGDTWTLSYSNPDVQPNFIEIVDSKTVWIATRRGLLNTSDGGLTWSIDYKKYALFEYNPTVAFKNSTHGWTSINRELLYTVDGGHIWKPVESWSFDTGFFQIRFVGEQLMWAGGLDGIFHSQDGGQTWTQQSNKSTRGLAIVSETEGWACYLSSHFSHMIDGQYWIEKHPPSRVSYSHLGPSHYTDLEFINPKQGWMVGSVMGVVYTPDGGLNWYEQKLPPRWSSLRAVDFINETHGWAVGWNGNIYRTRTGNQYGRRLIGEGYVIDLAMGGRVIPSSTVVCVILVAFGGIVSLLLIDRYLERRKSEPIQASLRIQW